MGTQMTTEKVGAPVNDATRWHSIDWEVARRTVRRLQMRIAKAVKEGKQGKVKSLQWLLTHSFHAKVLAVKRVTSNKGRKTPGVDGVLYKGAAAKMRAALSLRRHGYTPSPLRRIYIPKKNGKKRPLSIPTMYCRAMQALYKLALAPVAETTADPNSYGFREGRGCADAIAQAFLDLSKPNSATWILEGDIKGCFDNISFQWLEDNIPIDRQILGKWLRAGYVEKGITYPSRKGTPQGGIISPTLANMVLDGLEQAIHKAVPSRSRVNFVRYADDFIVTGKSRKILQHNVKPVIEAFLAPRGLMLSPEKTRITYIRKGFTFLGQTFRKHGNTLHVTPSKEGIKALIREIGTVFSKYKGAPWPHLIKRLNQILSGWGNYHRYSVASQAFRYVDSYVYQQLWQTVKSRHRNKSSRWLYRKYWKTVKGKVTFGVTHKTKSGVVKTYHVTKLSNIGIKRYIKVRAKANPYLKEYGLYFYKRRNNKNAKIAHTWGDVISRAAR